MTSFRKIYDIIKENSLPALKLSIKILVFEIFENLIKQKKLLNFKGFISLIVNLDIFLRSIAAKTGF